MGRIGVLSHLGRYEESEQLAREARRLLETLGHLEYLARLHMNQGSAAYHREKFAEALDNYQNALDTFDTLGQRDPMVVGLRVNLGIACSELSRIHDARRHFIQAEHDAEELGLHHLSAQARFNRAVTEALLGDYRMALKLLQQAESTFESEDATELTASTQLTRSEIYYELGLAEDAERDAETAAELYAKEEMALDAALSYLALARACALRGARSRARKLLETLAAQPQTRELPLRAALIARELASIDFEQGNLERARDTALEARKDLVRLGTLDASVRAGCIAAQAELAAGRTRAARDIVLALRRQAHRVPAGTRILVWSIAGSIERSLGRTAAARRCYRKAIEAIEQQRALVPGVDLRAESFQKHVDVYREYLDTVLDSRRPSIATVFQIMESARARGFRERSTGTSQSETVDAAARSRVAGLVRRLQQLEAKFTSSRATSRDQQELREARQELLDAERDLIAKLRRRSRDTSTERWSGSVDLESLQQALPNRTALIEYFVTRERILALVISRKKRHLVVLPAALQDVEKDAASVSYTNRDSRSGSNPRRRERRVPEEAQPGDSTIVSRRAHRSALAVSGATRGTCPHPAWHAARGAIRVPLRRKLVLERTLDAQTHAHR